MKKILIWIHASNSFGLGHFYRSIRLYKLLMDNYEIKICLNKNEKCENIYRDLKINYVNEQYLDNLEYLNDKIDLVIIDKLNTSSKIIDLFKSYDIKVICLDDNGPGAKHCDCLINGIVDLPPQCPSEYYQGIEYIIFSDELEKYKILKKENDYIKKVFVCFGGSDPQDITSKILPRICSFNDIKFDVVIGPGYKKTEEIVSKYRDSENINLIIGQNDLSKYIYDSDLCIVSGGLTLFECVFMNKNIFVACQVEHQFLTASIFEKKYNVKNLGIINNNIKYFDSVISTLERKNYYFSKNEYEIVNGKYKIKEIIDNIMR